MEDIKLEIGSHQTVTITKLYGPSSGDDIRITFRDYRWVIERKVLIDADDARAPMCIWVEMASLPGNISDEVTEIAGVYFKQHDALGATGAGTGGRND